MGHFRGWLGLSGLIWSFLPLSFRAVWGQSGIGVRGSVFGFGFFLVRDWKCHVISSRERHFQKWQVWHIRELETLTCDYLPIAFLTLINIMYLHFVIGVVVVEIITENHQYLSSWLEIWLNEPIRLQKEWTTLWHHFSQSYCRATHTNDFWAIISFPH